MAKGKFPDFLKKGKDKADKKGGKPTFEKGKMPMFAKGGSIDGCAKKGKTRA